MKVNINNIDQKYINIYRLILCILGRTSLIIMMVMFVVDPVAERKGNLYSTFTFQSNLLVALWLTITLIFYKKDDKPKLLHPGVRGAITLYITVTFLIFAFILALINPSPPVGIYAFTNFFIHYFIPVAFIIDWVITEVKNQYEWSYLLYWEIYPVGYLIYALIVGGITGVPIYPFFDLNFLGIGGLIFVIIGLTVFSILLSALYIFINRKLYDRFKA